MHLGAAQYGGCVDLNLRAAKLSPYTPLWIKVLPLVFVVLIGIAFMMERPWEQPTCVTRHHQVQCADDEPPNGARPTP